MQTKKQSLIETVTNTAIGFIISLLSTFLIFPLVGINVKPSVNIEVTLYFTVISILRGYILRRVFNKKSYKAITYPNAEPFTIYCFECEKETPAKEKDGDACCALCGLLHNNT